MKDKKKSFYGEDGLQYCAVCGEALEVFYPQNSIMKGGKHPRQCACERKVHEEEEKYREEKEHRELVERNRRICFEEKEMMNWTFQNGDKDNPVVEIAEDYVCNWDEMKKMHVGYLLWGPVGTGKSYIAGCIANALLEQEVTVKMTNFNMILNELFSVEDKAEYIRAMMRYELLIIDDLGAERSSEYAMENVFSVIDHRCCSGKPLIVTTNLPLGKLKGETDVDKKRIYDRILGMCVPVKVEGTSRRAKIARDKVQEVKTLLNV